MKGRHQSKDPNDEGHDRGRSYSRDRRATTEKSRSVASSQERGRAVGRTGKKARSKSLDRYSQDAARDTHPGYESDHASSYLGPRRAALRRTLGDRNKDISDHEASTNNKAAPRYNTLSKYMPKAAKTMVATHETSVQEWDSEDICVVEMASRPAEIVEHRLDNRPSGSAKPRKNFVLPQHQANKPQARQKATATKFPNKARNQVISEERQTSMTVKSANYSCDICKKAFDSWEHLENHCMKHFQSLSKLHAYLEEQRAKIKLASHRTDSILSSSTSSSWDDDFDTGYTDEDVMPTKPILVQKTRKSVGVKTTRKRKVSFCEESRDPVEDMDIEIASEESDEEHVFNEALSDREEDVSFNEAFSSIKGKVEEVRQSRSRARKKKAGARHDTLIQESLQSVNDTQELEANEHVFVVDTHSAQKNKKEANEYVVVEDTHRAQKNKKSSKATKAKSNGSDFQEKNETKKENSLDRQKKPRIHKEGVPGKAYGTKKPKKSSKATKARSVDLDVNQEQVETRELIFEAVGESNVNPELNETIEENQKVLDEPQKPRTNENLVTQCKRRSLRICLKKLHPTDYKTYFHDVLGSVSSDSCATTPDLSDILDQSTTSENTQISPELENETPSPVFKDDSSDIKSFENEYPVMHSLLSRPSMSTKLTLKNKSRPLELCSSDTAFDTELSVLDSRETQDNVHKHSTSETVIKENSSKTLPQRLDHKTTSYGLNVGRVSKAGKGDRPSKKRRREDSGDKNGRPRVKVMKVNPAVSYTQELDIATESEQVTELTAPMADDEQYAFVECRADSIRDSSLADKHSEDIGGIKHTDRTSELKFPNSDTKNTVAGTENENKKSTVKKSCKERRKSDKLKENKSRKSKQHSPRTKVKAAGEGHTGNVVEEQSKKEHLIKTVDYISDSKSTDKDVPTKTYQCARVDGISRSRPLAQASNVSVTSKDSEETLQKSKRTSKTRKEKNKKSNVKKRTDSSSERNKHFLKQKSQFKVDEPNSNGVNTEDSSLKSSVLPVEPVEQAKKSCGKQRKEKSEKVATKKKNNLSDTDSSSESEKVLKAISQFQVEESHEKVNSHGVSSEEATLEKNVYKVKPVAKTRKPHSRRRKEKSEKVVTKKKWYDLTDSSSESDEEVLEPKLQFENKKSNNQANLHGVSSKGATLESNVFHVEPDVQAREPQGRPRKEKAEKVVTKKKWYDLTDSSSENDEEVLKPKSQFGNEESNDQANSPHGVNTEDTTLESNIFSEEPVVQTRKLGGRPRKQKSEKVVTKKKWYDLTDSSSENDEKDLKPKSQFGNEESDDQANPHGVATEDETLESNVFSEEPVVQTRKPRGRHRKETPEKVATKKRSFNLSDSSTESDEEILKPKSQFENKNPRLGAKLVDVNGNDTTQHNDMFTIEPEYQSQVSSKRLEDNEDSVRSSFLSFMADQGLEIVETSDSPTASFADKEGPEEVENSKQDEMSMDQEILKNEILLDNESLNAETITDESLPPIYKCMALLKTNDSCLETADKDESDIDETDSGETFNFKFREDLKAKTKPIWRLCVKSGNKSRKGLDLQSVNNTEPIDDHPGNDKERTDENVDEIGVTFDKPQSELLAPQETTNTVNGEEIPQIDANKTEDPFRLVTSGSVDKVVPTLSTDPLITNLPSDECFIDGDIQVLTLPDNTHSTDILKHSFSSNDTESSFDSKTSEPSPMKGVSSRGKLLHQCEVCHMRYRSIASLKFHAIQQLHHNKSLDQENDLTDTHETTEKEHGKAKVVVDYVELDKIKDDKDLDKTRPDSNEKPDTNTSLKEVNGTYDTKDTNDKLSEAALSKTLADSNQKADTNESVKQVKGTNAKQTSVAGLKGNSGKKKSKGHHNVREVVLASDENSNICIEYEQRSDCDRSENVDEEDTMSDSNKNQQEAVSVKQRDKKEPVKESNTESDKEMNKEVDEADKVLDSPETVKQSNKKSDKKRHKEDEAGRVLDSPETVKKSNKKSDKERHKEDKADKVLDSPDKTQHKAVLVKRREKKKPIKDSNTESDKEVDKADKLLDSPDWPKGQSGESNTLSASYDSDSTDNFEVLKGESEMKIVLKKVQMDNFTDDEYQLSFCGSKVSPKWKLKVSPKMKKHDKTQTVGVTSEETEKEKAETLEKRHTASEQEEDAKVDNSEDVESEHSESLCSAGAEITPPKDKRKRVEKDKEVKSKKKDDKKSEGMNPKHEKSSKHQQGSKHERDSKHKHRRSEVTEFEKAIMHNDTTKKSKTKKSSVKTKGKVVVRQVSSETTSSLDSNKDLVVKKKTHRQSVSVESKPFNNSKTAERIYNERQREAERHKNGDDLIDKMTTQKPSQNTLPPFSALLEPKSKAVPSTSLPDTQTTQSSAKSLKSDLASIGIVAKKPNPKLKDIMNSFTFNKSFEMMNSSGDQSSSLEPFAKKIPKLSQQDFNSNDSHRDFDFDSSYHKSPLDSCYVDRRNTSFQSFDLNLSSSNNMPERLNQSFPSRSSLSFSGKQPSDTLAYGRNNTSNIYNLASSDSDLSLEKPNFDSFLGEESKSRLDNTAFGGLHDKWTNSRGMLNSGSFLSEESKPRLDNTEGGDRPHEWTISRDRLDQRTSESRPDNTGGGDWDEWTTCRGMVDRRSSESEGSAGGRSSRSRPKLPRYEIPEQDSSVEGQPRIKDVPGASDSSLGSIRSVDVSGEMEMDWSNIDMILAAPLSPVSTGSTSNKLLNQSAASVLNQSAASVLNQSATSVLNQSTRANSINQSTATVHSQSTTAYSVNQSMTSVLNQSTEENSLNQSAASVMSQSTTAYSVNQSMTSVFNQSTAENSLNQSAASVTSQSTITNSLIQSTASVTNQSTTANSNNESAETVLNQSTIGNSLNQSTRSENETVALEKLNVCDKGGGNASWVVKLNPASDDTDGCDTTDINTSLPVHKDLDYTGNLEYTDTFKTYSDRGAVSDTDIYDDIFMQDQPVHRPEGVFSGAYFETGEDSNEFLQTAGDKSENELENERLETVEDENNFSNECLPTAEDENQLSSSTGSKHSFDRAFEQVQLYNQDEPYNQEETYNQEEPYNQEPYNEEEPYNEVKPYNQEEEDMAFEDKDENSEPYKASPDPIQPDSLCLMDDQNSSRPESPVGHVSDADADGSITDSPIYSPEETNDLNEKDEISEDDQDSTESPDQEQEEQEGEDDDTEKVELEYNDEDVIDLFADDDASFLDTDSVPDDEEPNRLKNRHRSGSQSSQTSTVASARDMVVESSSSPSHVTRRTIELHPAGQDVELEPVGDAPPPVRQGPPTNRWIPPGFCFSYLNNRPCAKKPCQFRHYEPDEESLVSQLPVLRSAYKAGNFTQSLHMITSHAVIAEHVAREDLYALFAMCLHARHRDGVHMLLKLMLRRKIVTQKVLGEWFHFCVTERKTGPELLEVCRMLRSHHSIRLDQRACILYLRMFMEEKKWNVFWPWLLCLTRHEGFEVTVELAWAGVAGTVGGPASFTILEHVAAWLQEADQALLQSLDAKVLQRLCGMLNQHKKFNRVASSLQFLTRSQDNLPQQQQQQQVAMPTSSLGPLSQELSTQLIDETLRGREQRNDLQSIPGMDDAEVNSWIQRVQSCSLTQTWDYLADLYVEMCGRRCCPLDAHLLKPVLQALVRDPATSGVAFRDLLFHVNKLHIKNKQENPGAYLDEASLSGLGNELLLISHKSNNWAGGSTVLAALIKHGIVDLHRAGPRWEGLVPVALETAVQAGDWKLALQVLIATNVGRLGVPAQHYLLALFPGLMELLQQYGMLDNCYKILEIAFRLIYAGHTPLVLDENKFPLEFLSLDLIRQCLESEQLPLAIKVFLLVSRHPATFFTPPPIKRHILVAMVKCHCHEDGITALFEDLKRLRAYPTQSYCFPRKIVIPGCATGTEAFLMIRYYLQGLYNLMCEQIMENKTPGQRDLNLTVCIESKGTVPKDRMMVVLKEEQVSQQMVQNILRQHFQPPLRNRCNSVNTPITIEPLSLEAYLQRLDETSGRQGLVFPRYAQDRLGNRGGSNRRR